MRIKVGDIKDFEINRNYNKTAVEDGQWKPEAYKVNTIKIMRYLIYFKRRRDIELRSDIISNGSDIKSKSEAATRL